mgnify:CR=1 FL=1
MKWDKKGLFRYFVETDKNCPDVQLHLEPLKEQTELLHITLRWNHNTSPNPVTIWWTFPVKDTQGCWHPGVRFSRYLPPDWIKGNRSYATSSAPVHALYSQDGENRLTFALSDGLNVCSLSAGIREENGVFVCKAVLFDAPTPAMKEYHVALRIDARPIPWYETIQQVSQWWESLPGYTPVSVPEAGTLPMYSCWYSFHQDLHPEAIETQCAAAKKLGCDTVIVDDGWQTDDNARGYAYCGDWEMCASKIPDMAAHVARVHRLGMRYLLWYSVPFVGRRSKAWQRFSGKILTHWDEQGAAVLDPRYPEVREYLTGIYEKALREWNLDGFKLDFVDSFFQPEQENPQADPGRDFESVPEAVDVLLSGVITRLKALKPDIMIEFRQSYIGPLMRKYGNLFRAGDCPDDALSNRVSTIDLRLLCGNSAAHSDMLMWHQEEETASAALQILNVLYAVPQISVDLTALPTEHREMLAFWLSFWRKHRNILLFGQLRPHMPQLLYPLVEAEQDGTVIASLYGDVVAPIAEKKQTILINATRARRVVVEAKEGASSHWSSYNCCGHFQENGILKPGVQSIPVPPAGFVQIEE